MQKETFAECVSFLQGQFGVFQEDRMKTLWLAIQDLTDEEMKRATKNVAHSFVPSTTCPFPVPFHFRNACGKTPEEQALELMGMLQASIEHVGKYRSVDFGSPALHAAIQEFGGWVALCCWTQKEWDINHGRLQVAIEHAIKMGNKGFPYLPGITERTNGFLRPSDLIRITRDTQGKLLGIPSTETPKIDDFHREKLPHVETLSERMKLQ